MSWQNLEEDIQNEFIEAGYKNRKPYTWEFGTLSFRQYYVSKNYIDKERDKEWLSQFTPPSVQYIKCPHLCGRKVELRKGCKSPVPCECLRVQRRAA